MFVEHSVDYGAKFLLSTDHMPGYHLCEPNRYAQVFRADGKDGRWTLIDQEAKERNKNPELTPRVLPSYRGCSAGASGVDRVIQDDHNEGKHAATGNGVDVGSGRWAEKLATFANESLVKHRATEFGPENPVVCTLEMFLVAFDDLHPGAALRSTVPGLVDALEPFARKARDRACGAALVSLYYDSLVEDLLSQGLARGAQPQNDFAPDAESFRAQPTGTFSTKNQAEEAWDTPQGEDFHDPDVLGDEHVEAALAAQWNKLLENLQVAPDGLQRHAGRRTTARRGPARNSAPDPGAFFPSPDVFFRPRVGSSTAAPGPGQGGEGTTLFKDLARQGRPEHRAGRGKKHRERRERKGGRKKTHPRNPQIAPPPRPFQNHTRDPADTPETI